jgi:hypothetical protein
MSTDAAVASPSTPIGAAGDAMHAAAEALRDGAAEASASVQAAIPNVTHAVSRGIYHGSYYLSYGVVFSTVFLCHVIPGGKSLASGIVDGAQAGAEYVRGLRQPRPSR